MGLRLASPPRRSRLREEPQATASALRGDGALLLQVAKIGAHAAGQPFEQITSLTDVAEGTIVRVITRLDETCREVRDAARVIGDADLMKKMEEAQMKIKRDSKHLCVFCYVTPVC